MFCTLCWVYAVYANIFAGICVHVRVRNFSGPNISTTRRGTKNWSHLLLASTCLFVVMTEGCEKYRIF